MSSSASDFSSRRPPGREKRRLFRKALLFSAALLPAGCVSLETLAPPVTPALAAHARGDASALAAGRGIYLTQCTSCHAADSVAAHAGKWPRIIREMAPRAKLAPDQEHAVLAYVLAAERAQ